MPCSTRVHPVANGTESPSWLTSASMYAWAAAIRLSSETVTRAESALDSFDDGAGGQRAARAHGDQRGGLIGALQLVQRGGNQATAGRADRVAQRDRAAIDVDTVHVW